MRFRDLTLVLIVVAHTACSSDHEQKPPEPVAPSSEPSMPNGVVTHAHVATGGRLYDKFWSEMKLDAPTGDHPLWATRPDLESNGRSGSATWRCKECHGWDYKGVDGAYASGSHRTGFPGILGTARSRDEIVKLLKMEVGSAPGAHGYGTLAGMTDGALGRLAAFVRDGTIDIALMTDAPGRFTGAVDAGKVLFTSGIGSLKGCAACHGDDGLEIPGDNEAFTDFVGRIANANAAEFQHKVRFGQPGSDMPGYAFDGLTAAQVADLGAFAQTLPEGP